MAQDDDVVEVLEDYSGEVETRNDRIVTLINKVKDSLKKWKINFFFCFLSFLSCNAYRFMYLLVCRRIPH